MSPHVNDNDQSSLKSYLFGFGLSVVLTLIPFWIVMGDVIDNKIWAVAVIFLMAGTQMVVHIRYFLHVTLKAEAGWQAMALGLTVLLLVIVLSGSIWVLFNLQENMMPAHEQIERVRNLP